MTKSNSQKERCKRRLTKPQFKKESNEQLLKKKKKRDSRRRERIKNSEKNSTTSILPSNSPFCCICQDSIKEKKDLFFTLNCCNHKYHVGCIETWLKNQNTCCICRKRVKSCKKELNSIDGIPCFGLEENIKRKDQKNERINSESQIFWDHALARQLQAGTFSHVYITSSILTRNPQFSISSILYRLPDFHQLRRNENSVVRGLFRRRTGRSRRRRRSRNERDTTINIDMNYRSNYEVMSQEV